MGGDRCAPALAQCDTASNAKVCEHIHCQYIAESENSPQKIRVIHANVHAEFPRWHNLPVHNKNTRHAAMQHYCTHTRGRLGNCKCLCWEDTKAEIEVVPLPAQVHGAAAPTKKAGG